MRCVAGVVRPEGRTRASTRFNILEDASSNEASSPGIDPEH